MVERPVRNPFCQAFDLVSGQIIELHLNEGTALVYLMSSENVATYCAGRNDYQAEASMPFAEVIELVAGYAGRWFPP